MTGSYLDDSCKIQHGEFLYFDKYRDRTQLSNYKAGQLDGKIIFYSKGGIKMLEGFYMKGKYEGDWIGYYVSGKISGKAHYINDKQITGEYYK